MKKIRILALLLAILAVLPLAVSCTDAGKTTTATKPAATETKPATDPLTSATLYVAVNGSDDADGTKEKPLATIAGALSKLETLDKKITDVEINVGSGIYEVRETIRFTSGICDGRNVTVRGEDKTTLSGGITLNSADFLPADDELSDRFTDSARENIVRIDLKSHGIDVDSLLARSPEGRLVTVNGKLLTSCRYPDIGFLSVKNAIPESVRDEPITVDVSKSIAREMATWKDIDDAYVFIYIRQLWHPGYRKMLAYDPENATFDISIDDQWGLNRLDKFYIYNVPEEMTMPGEYYISRDGVLYIYKTDDFDGSSVCVAATENPIISFDGVSGVTLDNFVIENCNATAVAGHGDNLNIRNCVIRAAKNGIFLDGGHDIDIYNNEVYGILNSAIQVENDVLSTEPTNIRATYNNIYNYAINGSIANNGIGLSGSRNLIAHNEAHDANWSAFAVNGPLNVIEYNEAYNLMNYCNDVGVTHTGGRFTHYYGNTIRYNYYHGIGGTAAANSCCVGIYLDDCLSDQTVYGNILSDIIGYGVLIGGGRRNTVTGNLIINTDKGMMYDKRAWDSLWNESSYWYNDWGSTFLEERTDMIKNQAPWNTEEYRTAFPWLNDLHLDMDKADPDDKDFLALPADSVVRDNVMILSSSLQIQEYEKLSEEEKKTYKYNINDVSYKYSEIGEMTYILNESDHSSLEAVAKLDLPDFIDIPFDRIGRNPKVPD